MRSKPAARKLPGPSKSVPSGWSRAAVSRDGDLERDVGSAHGFPPLPPLREPAPFPVGNVTVRADPGRVPSHLWAAGPSCEVSV